MCVHGDREIYTQIKTLRQDPPPMRHVLTEALAHTDKTHYSVWGIVGFKCRGSMLKRLMGCVCVLCIQSQQRLSTPCASCASSLITHTSPPFRRSSQPLILYAAPELHPDTTQCDTMGTVSQNRRHPRAHAVVYTLCALQENIK